MTDRGGHTSGLTKGECFDLEDVVRCLPGGDASLSWMDTIDWVLLETRTNGSGEGLEVTIAQRHRPHGIGSSLTMRSWSSTVEDLGKKSSWQEKTNRHRLLPKLVYKLQK